MTNATKTLSAVFLLLLIFTALLKFGGSRSSSEAFSSTLVPVDTANISKMTVKQPDKSGHFVLKKEREGWTVSNSEKQTSYEADPNTVRNAIDKLTNLKVKAVATRDQKKYSRYKVDSTGTKVSLYEAGELAAEIIVGAPKMVNRRSFNSYVRPVDQEAVYTVDGFLNPTFNRPLADWRNKVVWKLERDKISRLDFLFPADSSYSIQRVGPRKWVSAKDTLEYSSVSSILGRLDELSADSFADSLSKEDFGTELYAIHLQLDNGVQKQLRIKPAGGEEGSYLAVASDYSHVFTLIRSTWDQHVLKARSELLQK